MAHTTAHPLAGKTVRVSLKARHAQLDGTEHEFVVDDYWDRITGGSWMDAGGNPACLIYALRIGFDETRSIPADDEVVYGKIGRFGHLIHTSELGEVVGG